MRSAQSFGCQSLGFFGLFCSCFILANLSDVLEEPVDLLGLVLALSHVDDPSSLLVLVKCDLCDLESLFDEFAVFLRNDEIATFVDLSELGSLCFFCFFLGDFFMTRRTTFYRNILAIEFSAFKDSTVREFKSHDSATVSEIALEAVLVVIFGAEFLLDGKASFHELVENFLEFFRFHCKSFVRVVLFYE